MIRIASKNKFLFALAVILAVAFLGVSTINYLVTREAVHAEIIRNDLPLTMDNIYSELTAMMTRPLLVSSSMASDAFLKEWALEGEKDTGKIIRYLEQIRERYDFFTTFFVSATTLRYYRYNGLHKTISPTDDHDVWYYNFLGSALEYDFDVDNDEGANNLLTIFVNYLVSDADGQVLGVTGVGLKVENVAERIARYQEKYGRIIYLTDRTGVVQIHPDTSMVENVRLSDMEGIGEQAEAMLAVGGNPKNFAFRRQGHDILTTVRYIPSLNWFLYVEQSETKTLMTARSNLIRTLLIGGLVSVVVILLTLVTINKYQERIEALAVSDELTGTANRRALEHDFSRAFYERRRNNRSFCLILFDLDGFKKINDVLGHMAGDRLLIELVGKLRACMRPNDTLARWGGDEFVILAAGSIAEVAVLAERVREEVAKAHFGSGGNDPRSGITLSGGISECRDDDDLDSLLLRADKAMYRSKERGGNQVEQSS
ncbi:MAG: sensor domain-containing diguanylate cyclase [Desulfopila sp.]|jgi:diguanylate cyclase (GGDEF)-like protein|nr:sensor domain-containing diguanylate cyclase [Desulfopila sp.]